MSKASKFRLLGDHRCRVREAVDAVPIDLIHALVPCAIHQDVEIGEQTLHNMSDSKFTLDAQTPNPESAYKHEFRSKG